MTLSVRKNISLATVAMAMSLTIGPTTMTGAAMAQDAPPPQSGQKQPPPGGQNKQQSKLKRLMTTKKY
jgi:hypothetical protein